MQANGNPADSAGVPWAGRTFSDNEFANDDGSISPLVAETLAAYRTHRDGARLAAVGQALLEHRVLIPVVAMETESGSVQLSPTGIDIAPDKSADVAMVSIHGPDGRPTLPVFSSVTAMKRWHPEARPIPVDARRAFLAAVDQECHVVCLDPAGPTTAVFPRPAVWAWAQGKPWVPFLDDQDARKELFAHCMAIPEVQKVAMHPGENTELELTFGVRAGLKDGQLQQVHQAIADCLATSTVIRDRVDSVAVRLLPV